ncbi:MAG: hypothetical protein CMN28_07960 [Salinisphaeraceae bacterium]|nr:hypothetical protein [Salinisphaeraceae bacterium]
MEADMQNGSLTEDQRLLLLEQLETSITSLRQELASRLMALGSTRARALAHHLLYEERDVRDIVGTELDGREYDCWISRATELENALADFQTGEYGWCEQCSSPIRFQKLRSQPAARQCDGCDAISSKPGLRRAGQRWSYQLG